MVPRLGFRHFNTIYFLIMKFHCLFIYSATAICKHVIITSLLFTDPDAPNAKEPIRRSWLHWAVVDIPGRDVNKGTTFAEYVGSGPPQGSGLHRYVFLVYKQKSKFEKIPKVIPAT